MTLFEYNTPECLTCGSKHTTGYPIYLAIPVAIVPYANTYYLCEVHKAIRYDYSDIYDENGKRKKIDHEAVLERCNA